MMDDSLYEQWLAQFVLVEDEAYGPGDPRPKREKAKSNDQRLERRRAQSREYYRRKVARLRDAGR